ncbi:endonuclease/exonuclease/phosphatase family protein [Neisseria sp. Ec49-e6-T10]|uniref:endonuclease/exonuclease/phosphatase family protein n=1 Tax=Neisseria sp. Ec49-e6-T10 TaxID=3140744 RepID=UPI003EBC1833
MSILLPPLKIVTYNIHKGMSALNRYVRLYSIAMALQKLDANIIFLQEVQGEHKKRARKYLYFPEKGQHDFLAQSLGLKATYGKNALYEHKHHGNAILSNLPLIDSHNLDISVNAMENRGILHCTFKPEGWPTEVVALCAHLNLLHHDRKKQYQYLIHYIQEKIDPKVPLILAGDFNDWQNKASDILQNELNLQDVFIHRHGAPAKSFPSRMPFFTLDRIYTRYLLPIHANVHTGIPWTNLSDHLPLSTSLILNK